ncbi:MAG: helix-turn-helix transcriptional regulator [Acholeplasma sp.]|nr:helix-turn-helix transcriptional regulator [Acholeplasma sp.]
MTIGEKLNHYRVLYDYSIEQIAELLQTDEAEIIEYESDLKEPDALVLTTLARVYNIMVDDFFSGSEKKALKKRHYVKEYQSKKKLFGIPLVHILIGKNNKARGIIAIGLDAQGFIAIGMFSRGLLSIGVLSLGLLSLGSIAFGLLSLAAIAFGGIAVGAVAIGLLSIGGLSIGLFSFGGAALGRYLAVGNHAIGMIAIGKSSAEGSLYESVSNTNRVIYDPIIVFELLKAQTPNWIQGVLSWVQSKL